MTAQRSQNSVIQELKKQKKIANSKIESLLVDSRKAKVELHEQEKRNHRLMRSKDSVIQELKEIANSRLRSLERISILKQQRIEELIKS